MYDPLKAYEDDKLLAAQCAEGRREAQELLYNRYAKAMFNSCIRLVGFSQAKDLLQDVFTDVFIHIGSYRAESSLGSWIKRIAVNKCLNEIKRKKIEWEDLDEWKEGDIVDEAEEYEEADVKAIYLAIEQLPDGYRQVFNLFVFEDFSHRQIAEVLGISESTSKTQYFKAKNRIKELVYKLKKTAE